MKFGGMNGNKTLCAVAATVGCAVVATAGSDGLGIVAAIVGGTLGDGAAPTVDADVASARGRAVSVACGAGAGETEVTRAIFEREITHQIVPATRTAARIIAVGNNHPAFCFRITGRPLTISWIPEISRSA